MSTSTQKKTLQEVFPERELLTVAGCVERLGWSTENPPGDERGTGRITCDCGTRVKVGGWIGTEHAWCPGCGKGMQDMTGLLPAERHCAGHIDYDEVDIPDDGAIWTPENVWGFHD